MRNEQKRRRKVMEQGESQKEGSELLLSKVEQNEI
jgi:hypothetical protein